MSTRMGNALGPVQKKLALALEQARIEHEHHGNRGASVEEQFRQTLRDYLPRHMSVAHGEIIDAYGDTSGQTDVIICNDEQPFAYPDGGGLYIMDGVSAVGEVKSKLTTEELDKTIRSASRYKRLRVTPTMGDTISNHDFAYIEETQAMPPYFLFAFENNVAVDTIKKKITEAQLIPTPEGKELVDMKSIPQHPLDAVFILGTGFTMNLRSGNGPIIFEPPGQQPWKHWQWVSRESTDEPDKTLFWLLVWLHHAMPRYNRQRSPIIPYLAPFDIHKEYMKRHGIH